MTPTEKHRETATEIMRRSAYRGSVAGLIEEIAAALATAEREGMKRAAEIVSDPYRHAPYENPDAEDLFDAVRAAILSEAREGA